MFEPIGQTFTAEDPFVLASLYYAPINPQVANSDPIKLTLYGGPGVGGTVLGSDTFSLSDGFSGFRDSDFSSVALTVGSVYTIAAEIVGTSPYWGAGSGSSYAGGAAVLQGSIVDIDLAFRITPVAAVPEPGTLALLGLGLAGLAASRRRSKQ